MNTASRLLLGPVGGSRLSPVPPSLGSYARFWAGDPAWSHPADGGAVDSWRNMGSLGTAATQATGSAQPLYRESSINGRPAVDFVSSDYLEILTGVSLAQPYTVVIVANLDTAGGNMAAVGLNSASVNSRLGTNATPAWVLNAGTALAGGTPAASKYLVRGYANGASSVITVNGTTVASGNANTGALDQIILGAGRTAPATYATFFDGQIAWVDIIAGDATTHAMWSAYRYWLSRHYRITVA